MTSVSSFKFSETHTVLLICSLELISNLDSLVNKVLLWGTSTYDMDLK